ncbi:hypothetical protein [Treponema endosymbiont of Eucomonympha sp.]|uniref:hypothetical protein n=1 Tax=Treponema endosymbiont of Eucomonympha sp. TaxID=1580831 RepID=UPI001396B41A|nr:hypothetical protein [Treponema endosymbiont of Eucomonympha sp.]
MRHASYCLYRKKEKNCVMWYAKFWDYEKRRYWAYRTLKVRASRKYLRRTAAREAAEEMLGGLKKSASADESFAGFLARFWELGGICERAHFLKTRKKISRSYLKSSSLLVKKHIAPNHAFSANSAEELSAGMVHDFMADKAKQGASEDLINKCLKVIRVATRYLFEWGD